MNSVQLFELPLVETDNHHPHLEIHCESIQLFLTQILLRALTAITSTLDKLIFRNYTGPFHRLLGVS